LFKKNFGDPRNFGGSDPTNKLKLHNSIHTIIQAFVNLPPTRREGKPPRDFLPGVPVHPSVIR
jgi:hypothetical protein